MTSAFDFIVVGSGSSGSVLVSRLTDDPATSVLLLEAGGLMQPEIRRPMDLLELHETSIDWSYETEPCPGLGSRRVKITRGRVLGGSYTLSAARQYVRGNRRDYDHWNYLGNEGWSYQDVLPYFKKSECFVHGADGFHGGGGPMDVGYNPHPTAVAPVFIQAAMELGFAGSQWDYNGAVQEGGAFLYQHTVGPDERLTGPAASFALPALDRPNLTVSSDSKTVGIALENGRAVGVEYVRGGTRAQVLARREIILCGGSINSPQLLLLSGIGPRRQLEELEIPVHVDLPGVGQNLQDHLLLLVYHRSKIDLPDPFFTAETGLFTNSRENMTAASPDLQVLFTAGVPFYKPHELHGPSYVFIPVLIQPQSRGTLCLADTNPDIPPRIQPNYLDCLRDYEALRRGVDLVRRLAAKQAFAAYEGGEFAPGAQAGEKQIEEYIRSSATTIWHPAGTCKMGSDRMAVVDPTLCVHGIRGLRVADASIMPLIVSGNINAPCMMIGEKAADLIGATPWGSSNPG